MKHSTLFWVLGLCTVGLSSCVSYQENYTPGYQAYVYDNSQLYPQGNYRMLHSDERNQGNQAINVPDSYHVGEYHSPVSFKDRDRNWVSSQNAEGYTIEVADDEKASQVAEKLYKAPKSDRMAQVKYQHHGKTYYKGVYGTYNNAKEAQKALDALPEDIRNGAGVKSWGSIQNNLE